MIAAAGLAVGGFAALSLAMDRHGRDVFGQRPPPGRARALRAAGWTALAASLPPCVAAEGWGIGITLWCGVLTAAAAGVLLTMSARPGAVPGLGVGGGVLGMAALVRGVM